MDKRTIKQFALVLFGFGFLCLLTSGFFNMDKEKAIIKVFPAEGGLVGPLEVSKDKSVYNIAVEQKVGDKQWSSISGEVLDANKEYLFGFGKDLWAESGRDYDGYWSESISKFKTKLTVPKKGTYFLNFTAETSPGVGASMYVTVRKKHGSALPFFLAGMISILLAIAMNYFADNFS